MRPNYGTESIVLHRAPLGEASALVYLLTSEFGLIKARAQGIRKPGAKLSPALQTLTELDAMLVRGKEYWRLSGALLVQNHFPNLSPLERKRAGRVTRLLLRLVHGETKDAELFYDFRSFLINLARARGEEAEAAECLAALQILRTLGLHAGEIPEGDEALSRILQNRKEYIQRVNRGILASGL